MGHFILQQKIISHPKVSLISGLVKVCLCLWGHPLISACTEHQETHTAEFFFFQ